MSTEHQRYSLSAQSAVINAFSNAHGLEVIQTYSDPGRSGLSLKDRPGLRALLADVAGGVADFEKVLVLDVSRWGRFQNPDEAAHYEFLCRSAGVSVVYCDEPFGQSDEPVAKLVKQLKRVMAADFSRQIGEGVRRGKMMALRDGYRGGGPAPYGFRRQIVGEDGVALNVLQFGQRRALKGQRVKLVHGPREELATIKRIFRMRALGRLNVREITRRLNVDGIPSLHGLSWSDSRTRAVLKNEQVVGVQVWGRHWCRLQRKGVRTPEEWARTVILPPIVPNWMFRAAQTVGKKSPSETDDEIADALRALWKREKYLSTKLIDETPAVPGAKYIYRRFGGRSELYRFVGYPQFSEGAERLAYLIAEKRL